MHSLTHLFILDFDMKIKPKVNLFSTLFFTLLLSLILVQSIFKIIPESRLYGVTEKVTRPGISLEKWFDGSLQKELEAWVDQSLGFRSYLIKSDNQINYLLFKESHQKTENKIIVGADNYLYEDSYIKSYLGRDSVSDEILMNKAHKLKKLQDLLTEKGIEFIFLISPSKASFYPEHIPGEIVKKTADKDQSTNYEKFLPFLEQSGVNYIDSREMLLNLKKDSPYPLFSKSGTHWTYYGSCLVVKKIFNNLIIKKEKSFNLPDCSLVELNSIPQGTDSDLAELMNIWTPNVFYEKLAYPKFNNNPNEINDLNFLIVGDSFSWALIRNIEEAKLLLSYNLYYYFKTAYEYGKAARTIDVKNTPLLKEEILKNNVVILENNEAGLSLNDFGFLDASLEALSN